MHRYRNIFDFVFILIASGELLSHLLHSGTLQVLFKPLLLLWLSIIFYLVNRHRYNNYSRLIQAGFIFSWIGDILLMFDQENEKYFLAGLISFLFTHICYLSAFIYSVKGKPSFLRKNWFLAFPFIIAGSINISMLYPKLNELAFPVIIYGSAIIAMVIGALNRKNAVSSQSFWMVFAGAFLFMISDSILSANKFLFAISNAEFLIMAFYISAQYLIMKGSLKGQETFR